MTARENENFRKFWNEANDIGNDAAKNCKVVCRRWHDPYSGRLTKPYPQCGNAWIVITPATTKFARWLKQEGLAEKNGSGSGISHWISGHGQSFDRKMAHANAMAKFLTENGINAKAYGGLS